MPNIERLEALLNAPKPEQTIWDFGVVRVKTDCGTLACLMGELPYIFPDDWKVSGYSVSCGQLSNRPAAMRYFDLTEHQYWHLFMPRMQLYGRPKLPEPASREEVMDNLRDFIERVKSGEIT